MLVLQSLFVCMFLCVCVCALCIALLHAFVKWRSGEETVSPLNDNYRGHVGAKHVSSLWTMG